MITVLVINFIESLLDDIERPRYLKIYFKNTSFSAVLIMFLILLCFPTIIIDLILLPFELIVLILFVIIKRIRVYLDDKNKKK